MATNREDLKAYFNTGDRPTEVQFAELIDNSVNNIDDKANLTEAAAGNDDVKYITPKTAKKVVETFASSSIPTATISTQGKIEIATLAEVQAGTDTARAVTPEGSKKSVETFAPVKSVNGQTGIVNLNIPTITDSSWQTPTLLNSVTNFGSTYQTVRYRKIQSIVYIEGVVKGGTTQTNGLTYSLFVLPSGFRPLKRHTFIIHTGSGLAGRLDIDPNGNVYAVIYNNANASLSGISFFID